MSSIRVILGLVASLDLELEQLELKTAIILGNVLIVGQDVKVIDDLKDLSPETQILGILVLRYRKVIKLWLSQERCVNRIQYRLKMKTAMSVKMP